MLGFAPLASTPLASLPLEGDYSVIADASTLTITGHDVGLYANRVLTAEVGAIAVTGFDVDYMRARVGLNVSGSGGVRGLRASSGGGGKGLRIRA